jgi:hypothetical protein
MRLEKVVRSIEVVDLPEDDMITIAEAALLTGMTGAGIRSALNRGSLTEYHDPLKHWHEYRLVSRAEVVAYASRK